MSQEDKKLIGTMVILMAAYTLIASIPTLIFSKDRLGNELGLVIGLGMGVAMLFHMHAVTVRSFYYEGNKKALFIRNSILRYVFVGGLLAAAGLTGFVNPLFMLIGMLSLKVSAYLQPVVSKIVGIKK